MIKENRRIYRCLEYLLQFIRVVALLLIVLLLLLRSNYVQNYITDRVFSMLSERYEAELSVGEVHLKYFDQATITELYLEDQAGDTLFYTPQLKVDISLFSLFEREIFIDRIEIKDLTAKVYKNGETFNFDFLISPSDTTLDTSDSRQPWSLDFGTLFASIDHFSFQDSTIHYKLHSADLRVELNLLDLENSIVDINEVAIIAGVSEFQYTGSIDQTEQNSFALPDVRWKIAGEELVIDNHQLYGKVNGKSFIVDNWKTRIDSILMDSSRWTGQIMEWSLNSNTFLQLKSLQARLNLSDQGLIINEFTFQTDTDDLSSEKLMLNLGSSPLYTLEKTTASLSPEFIKMMVQLLDLPYNPVSGRPLEIQWTSASYSSMLTEVKEASIDYGNAFRMQGSAMYCEIGNSRQMMDMNLSKLIFNPRELDRILKGYKVPDSLLGYQKISAQTRASGTSDSLHIDRLAVSMDEALNLSGSGYVLKILNPEELYYRLYVDSLNAIVDKLPYTKQTNLALDSLAYINYAGRIDGSKSSFCADGQLSSQLGQVDLDIEFKELQDGIEEISYDGHIVFTNFDLGTLLKREDLSTVSISTSVNGSGFRPGSMNTRMDGVVDSIEYMGYIYRDVKVNAELEGNQLDGKVSVDDENIKAQYEGLIILDSNGVEANFIMHLDTLIPWELGLYASQVGLRGKISSRIKIPLVPGEKGIVKIYDFGVNNLRDKYVADSILLLTEKKKDSTFLTIHANFLDAEVAGIFGIRELPIAFAKIYQGWNPQVYSETSAMASVEAIGLRMKAKLHYLKPLDILMPENKIGVREGSMDMTVGFQDETIEGNIRIDSISYGDFFAEVVQVLAKPSPDQQELDLNAKGINWGRLFSIYNISINNDINDQEINTSYLINDRDGIPSIALSTMLHEADNKLNLSLRDSFTFNKKEWGVPDNNNIVFDNGYILIDNLALQSNDEYLTINSRDSTGTDFVFNFNDFSIGQFTSLLTSQPSQLEGYLNGKVELLDVQSNMYYLVNVSIDNLIYEESRVGSLEVKANEDPASGIITTNVELSGNKNLIRGGGTYHPYRREIDVQLDMESFEMRLLDPFLTDIISESEGLASGWVDVSGPISNAYISGEITFDHASTVVDVNKTRYTIDDHSIQFDDHIIELQDLPLKDQRGNEGLVTGYILHDFFNNVEFFIDFASDDFEFLNTTSRDNPIFYGRLIMDSDIELTGTPDLALVEVIASPLDSTTMTLSPFSETDALLKDDFIRYGTPEQDKELSVTYLKKIARKYPFDVNLLLEANEKALFKFIIDPLTGDNIQGRGYGNLRIQLNPDGTQEIYGNYKVQEGKYAFSYGDFISKNFTIQKGSTVRFNGNPLEAELDINAVYKTQTSPYELIKNEIALSESEAQAAKKRTMVEVILKLTGSLLSPEIKLDIQVPNLQSGILVNTMDRKLNELRNNPDELNNQVFGLLLFNSFLLSSSTTTSFNNVGNDIALSSISGLISSQLNNLAKDVVKGVNIEVDVNSYNSEYLNEGAGGNITQVGLRISKQLFNDRLSIRAGGNFNVESVAEQSQFSSFIGDFVLEYKLTETGSYRIRVFSRSDYDRLLNENTNRNGVSLFFDRSFDSKLDND